MNKSYDKMNLIVNIFMTDNIQIILYFYSNYSILLLK